MGCFPAPRTGMSYRLAIPPFVLRHDSGPRDMQVGGRFKTFPMAPGRESLIRMSDLECAHIEIRQAIRAGIDGFAVDAWAGMDDAKRMLAALFQAAEEGDYPFEITLCLDPWTMGASYKDTVMHLLERHRKSPKLARRDGRPLFFGYQSQGIVAGNPKVAPMTQEAMWTGFAEAYRKLEEAAGEKLFFHLDFSHLLLGSGGKMPPGKTPDDVFREATTYLRDHVDAIGSFIDISPPFSNPEFIDEMAGIVAGGKAEWSPALWHQYHNINGATLRTHGIDKFLETWNRARTTGATLLQYTTWNDYGEHTSLAPTLATGYGLTELNRYFAQWWKEDQEPVWEGDRIFLIYYDAMPGSEAFPFRGQTRSGKEIQVITILEKPGKVRLPGRSVDGKPGEYDAPAGFHLARFEPQPGKVAAELVRDGKVVKSLVGTEWITERPFRDNPTLHCASTVDESAFAIDYPGEAYPREAFYADDDGNGLPNWFEMYYFGRMGDFTTVTGTDPKADPDQDGLSNREEYLAQSDPTLDARYKVGEVWSLEQLLTMRNRVNPTADQKMNPVWHYLYAPAKKEEGEGRRRAGIERDGQYLPMSYPHKGMYYSHGKVGGGTLSFREPDPKKGTPGELDLSPIGPGHPSYRNIALGWQSPITGKVDIQVRVRAAIKGGRARSDFTVEAHDGTAIQRAVFNPGDTMAEPFEPWVLREVPVKKGEFLRFVAGNSALAILELKITCVEITDP